MAESSVATARIRRMKHLNACGVGLSQSRARLAPPAAGNYCFGAVPAGLGAGGDQRLFSVGVNSVLTTEPLTSTVNVFSAGTPSTPSTVKRTVRGPITV